MTTVDYSSPPALAGPCLRLLPLTLLLLTAARPTYVPFPPEKTPFLHEAPSPNYLETFAFDSIPNPEPQWRTGRDLLRGRGGSEGPFLNATPQLSSIRHAAVERRLARRCARPLRLPLPAWRPQSDRSPAAFQGASLSSLPPTGRPLQLRPSPHHRPSRAGLEGPLGSRRAGVVVVGATPRPSLLLSLLVLLTCSAPPGGLAFPGGATRCAVAGAPGLRGR